MAGNKEKDVWMRTMGGLYIRQLCIGVSGIGCIGICIDLKVGGKGLKNFVSLK